MKKIILVSALAFALTEAFAWNPPAGSQSLFNLSSPTQLTSASSSCGGGLFMPGADSIAFNPALTSFEERVQLDFGFTGLISTETEYGDDFNYALQTGILIPTKWFVFSGILNGMSVEADDMYIGKNMNIKAGLSKEITERFSVGANLTGGFMWDCGEDWSLGVDAGVLYRREKLRFLKDFRLGAALLNLGKMYEPEEFKILGIDEDDFSVDSFPGLVTLKAGTAARFLDTDQFTGGFSFDVTVPSFQDCIVDAGLQMGFRNVFFLNVSEKIDFEEIKYEKYDLMPAIGVSFKINLNAKGSYFKAHNWDKSEMLASLAWQQKYETVQAVSGGARIYLGQKDTQGPVIQMWNGEDD